MRSFRLYRPRALKGPGPGHSIHCQSCLLSQAADSDSYSCVLPRPVADLGELMRMTFPNFYEVYRDRLALEDQLQAGTGLVAPRVRAEMVAQTLQMMAPEVDACLARPSLDPGVGAGCLLTLVVPFFLAALLEFGLEVPSGSDLEMILFLGSFGLGVVGTLYLAFTGTRRSLRRVLVPKLARALAPLRPTETELAASLADFERAGLKIGKAVRASEVVREMGRRTP